MIVVPTVEGRLDEMDLRLVRLAEVLGAGCRTVEVDANGFIDETHSSDVGKKRECFVINAQLMGRYFALPDIHVSLRQALISRFAVIFVYNCGDDRATRSTLKALVGDSCECLRHDNDRAAKYEVSSRCPELCGIFSGLEYSSTYIQSEHRFSFNSSSVETVISVNNLPMLARVHRGDCELLLLAGTNFVDVGIEVGCDAVSEYFPQVIPTALMLRYVCGSECWQPAARSGTLIIDDPLLHDSYGFVDYGQLLKVMKTTQGHTAIAFIPFNYRRSRQTVTRLFREYPAHLSLCYHGTDHTAAEYACKDLGFLNTAVRTAVSRMRTHRELTGISCDNVFVFPQGEFSREALVALRCNNFLAAINSRVEPRDEALRLPLYKLLEPALLSIGEFPVFQRRVLRDWTHLEIAWSLFFGKPLFVVEHHQSFADMERITAELLRITRVAKNLTWDRCGAVVEQSYLRRLLPDGTFHFRCFGTQCIISNPSSEPLKCLVEWPGKTNFSIETLLVDGRDVGRGVNGHSVILPVEIAPNTASTCTLRHRNVLPIEMKRQGLVRKTRVLGRRILSELRDNHLSKSPTLAKLLETCRQRLARH